VSHIKQQSLVEFGSHGTVEKGNDEAIMAEQSHDGD